MKTILFMLRFFMNPFKVTNSMIFNKGDRKENPISKTLKICCKVVFGVIGFTLLVVILSEDKDKFDGVFGSVKFDYAVGVYKKEEDDEGTNQLLPDNPDGSVNGLNLQLIDSIETEGYVKEYLTIARNNYNGVYNSIPNNIPVDLVLASSLNESGTYPGTPLPVSYLPWDTSSNSVLWKKSISGYPSEALTLLKANKNVFSGNFGVGSVTPYASADEVNWADTDNGGTASQFQVALNTFPNTIVPNVNGYKSSSGRSPDITYFPDQLSNLSGRYNSYVESYVSEQLNEDKYKKMIYSMNYNPGWGNIVDDVLSGYSVSDPKAKEILDILYEELNYVFHTAGDKLSNRTDYGARTYHASVYLPLLHDRGWKVDFSHYLYDYQDFVNDAYNEYSSYGYSEDFSSFANKVSSSIDSKSLYRTSPKLQVTRAGHTIIVDGIMLGHLYSKVFVGQSVYAKMLKYAGVNVDTTNPNDYIDTLPEGEWKPSGDSVWMTNEKVDMNKLDKTGEKILNEGKKYLGLPYIYGGNDPNVGLDCSSFVQWTYRRSIGMELPRTTYEQARLGREVSISEAKPGDLVFYYTTNRNDPSNCEHVAIFMGMDGNQPRIMHAPYPGKDICITTWDGSGGYGYNDWSIRRVTD